RPSNPLMSKRFAAGEEGRRGEPPLRLESTLLWGVFSTFLAFLFVAIGVFMPVVGVGYVALTLAWVFCVFTLLVAFRGLNRMIIRVPITLGIAALVGYSLIWIARHRPQ